MEKVRDKDNEKNIWLAFSPIKQNPLNFVIQKGTEPSETSLRCSQGLVLAAYPAFVADSVHEIEQESVVDLACTRLVAPRVVGYLHVLDHVQISLDSLGQVPFHDLHVVDVIL